MAAEITVDELPDGDFEVEVRDGPTVTRHVVTVPPGFTTQFGDPDLDPAELVRQSFVFLLEQEPATSILSRFGLDVIPRYFPDYVDSVRGQLG